jgi:hypothetical protein
MDARTDGGPARAIAPRRGPRLGLALLLAASVTGCAKTGRPATEPNAPAASGGYVDVRGYGAKGDGATDDTAAFQAAFDTERDVFVPEGSYLVGNVQPRPPQRVFGLGSGSRLLQRPGSAYVLSVNPGAGGTPSPRDNLRGLTLSGLTFVGRVERDGFSEHVHLVTLSAVSDVLVERCRFVGFQGDGLYLGSGNEPGIERHNERVVIRDCAFDGVTGENRNGLSVIDVDGLLVEDCVFTNTTRAGMPGSIDLEPNNDDTAIISDVVVRRCSIRGGTGAGVAANLRSNPRRRRPWGPIRVERCRIEKPVALSFRADLVRGAPPPPEVPSFELTWEANLCSGGRSPFVVSGLVGGRIVRNVFEDFSGPAELGYTAGVRDVTLEGNEFRHVGTANGTALLARWWDSVRLLGNEFVDVGRADGRGGRAIGVAAGEATRVELRGNAFSCPASRTTRLLGLIGGTVSSASVHAADNVLECGAPSDVRL